MMSSPRRREGKYALGLRLFEYGRQVERKWDISRAARPYMEHLSQRTGASVMLSICEGGSVITLDQVEARDKLRIVSDAGARLPIYCTSQGKVFLAHMPRAQAEKLLRRQSMTQFTPHTITDVSVLLQEVDACRTNGFAIENGEYKIGLRSISAPGLHGGPHRALHRGRYRHVPQHPFRRVPQRSGAGLRHRRHDLRRSGLSRSLTPISDTPSGMRRRGCLCSYVRHTRQHIHLSASPLSHGEEFSLLPYVHRRQPLHRSFVWYDRNFEWGEKDISRRLPAAPRCGTISPVIGTIS